MDASTDALRTERCQEVLDLAHPRLPADRHGAFDTYARECFDQFDGEDLTERRVEDLAGALLSHWQFGSHRQPGEIGRAHV